MKISYQKIKKIIKKHYIDEKRFEKVREMVFNGDNYQAFTFRLFHNGAIQEILNDLDSQLKTKV